MNKITSSFLFASLVLGSTVACGDLGDVDDRPTLAVIDGRLLQQASEAAPDVKNVRVAVVWHTSTTGFKSTHDVPVVPVFPSSFRVELADPPPVAAMIGAGAGSSDEVAPTEDNTSRAATRTIRPLAAGRSAVAIGTVVAYEDVNRNGGLDLLDPHASPIDRVLGANEELLVVYLEGELPPAGMFRARGTPVRGYNLLRQPACDDAPGLPGGGSPPAPCDAAEWLPIATVYDLPLTASPTFARMMCGSTSSSSTASATKTNVKPGESPPPAPGPEGWPKKDELGISCARDGRTYSWTRCESKSLGLCKGTADSCTENTYALPSGTVPVEWPCVVQ